MGFGEESLSHKYIMIKVDIKNNNTYEVIDDCECTPGLSYQIEQMKESLKQVKNIFDLKKIPNFKFMCIIHDSESNVAYFEYNGK